MSCWSCSELRRVDRGRGRRGRGRRRACNRRLEIGNLARNGDHVGVVGRVKRFQRLLLLDQILQLFLALSGEGAAPLLGRLRLLDLLRNHGLQEGLVLLQTGHCLGGSIELSGERLQSVCVGVLLIGEHAEMLLLKSCQFRVLLVKVLL